MCPWRMVFIGPIYVSPFKTTVWGQMYVTMKEEGGGVQDLIKEKTVNPNPEPKL